MGHDDEHGSSNAKRIPATGDTVEYGRDAENATNATGSAPAVHG